ncbi:uncharacterized protein LOC111325953 [Stylophora pistillata]|uniref:uncharacterized protein LOC111325953 n=1 Tax=Stylophora pistillata TaxID=50429 RepID=UPI000C048E2D|nr:uncharacterized protein LOC111325953 [Stylophora pistillata]
MCIKRSCSVRRAQSFPEFELSKMDDYHTIASKGQRLALAHFVIGIALIATGVMDRLMSETWVGYSGFGILVGIWMCFTGGLGVSATKMFRTQSTSIYAALFMAFSIVSSMCGLIISTFYGLTDMRPLNVTMLILGVLEFGIGIAASVCCCLMKPCTCCCCISPDERRPLMHHPGGQPVLVSRETNYVVAVPVM